MKRSLYLILLIVLVLILVSCKASLTMDKSIKTLKEHSELNHYLLDKEDTNQFVSYLIVPGFGMTMYCDPEEDVDINDVDDYMNEHPLTCYTFTGYPDVLDENMITRITTSDSEVRILGIRAGEMYDTSHQTILSQCEYQLDKHDQYQEFDEYLFTNSKIYLKIVVQNEIISRLTIYVEVTNKQHVIF